MRRTLQRQQEAWALPGLLSFTAPLGRSSLAPRQKKEAKKSSAVCVLFLYCSMYHKAILLIAVIFMVTSCTSPGAPASGTDQVCAGSSQEAINMLIKAVNTGDHNTILQLYDAGSMFAPDTVLLPLKNPSLKLTATNKAGNADVYIVEISTTERGSYSKAIVIQNAGTCWKITNIASAN